MQYGMTAVLATTAGLVATDKHTSESNTKLTVI